MSIFDDKRLPVGTTFESWGSMVEIAEVNEKTYTLIYQKGLPNERTRDVAHKHVENWHGYWCARGLHTRNGTQDSAGRLRFLPKRTE